MALHVARPQFGASKACGIIVFQEAFGVNAHIRDVAERFAAVGFTAVAPELFHRTAPGCELPYDDFASTRPHLDALTAEGMAEDARAAYDWLRQHGGCERISAVGFCMGGRVAYLANAHLDLSAAVSFYGGGSDPKFAAQQRAPILMFWGGRDAHIPPEQYRALADALTAAGKTHEQVVFSQAGHAFFCDARANYEDGAARQAWAMTLEFLRVFGALQ